jgi:hypothetical protein
LGFLVYWVQIWREYTNDSTTALYAASLIPAPVAAGRMLGAFPAALTMVSVAVLASFLWEGKTESEAEASPGPPWRPLFEARWYAWLTQWLTQAAKAARKLGITILGIVAAVVGPLVTGHVRLDSPSDVFFYLCAAIIAGAGGLYSAQLLLLMRPADLFDFFFRPREYRRRREFRAWWVRSAGYYFRSDLQSFATLVTSILVAALFLMPLQSPPLASVRFSSVASEDAKLLTHEQGYWYVIKDGNRNVMALPDEAVGNVTISPHP